MKNIFKSFFAFTIAILFTTVAFSAHAAAPIKITGKYMIMIIQF